MEQSIGKLVSVIVTTYNRADDFLIRAINSVINQQTQFDYEIIVIDDNGLDSSKQKETKILLEQYIVTNAIKYLPQQSNVGACIGRNQGVAHAIGTYIFFLDDDDEFLPNKIEEQVTFLENNPDFDGCLSAFQRIDYKGSNMEADSNYPKVGSFVDFAIQGNFFTPMLCIKKSSLQAVGGFKTISRFQDRYLMLHCLLKGQQFGIINKPLYVLYDHNENRITSSDIERTRISYDTIYDFVLAQKKIFTITQWRDFKYSHYKSIAVSHYVNSSYFKKLKGIIYWIFILFIKFKYSDFLMIFKSFVPKKN